MTTTPDIRTAALLLLWRIISPVLKKGAKDLRDLWAAELAEGRGQKSEIRSEKPEVKK